MRSNTFPKTTYRLFKKASVFVFFFVSTLSLHSQTFEFSLKASPNISMTFNTIDKYQNGLVQYNFLRLNVNTDRTWDMYVGANTTVQGEWDETMSYSANGDDPDISILQLRFRNANNTPLNADFFPIRDVSDPVYIIGSSALDAQVNCGLNNTNEAGSYLVTPGCFRFNVDLLVKPGFTYRPGLYTMEIVFTLMENYNLRCSILNIPKHILILLFLGISFVVLGQPSEKRYGVYMNYVEGYTIYTDDGICSNIIKVYNNTDKRRILSLRTLGAPNWRSMGSNERSITIEARDSAFVPIRVLPTSEVKGGEIVRFNTSLFNEGMMITSSEWIIEAKVIHNWKAQILSKKNYFLHNSDSSSVSIHFSNRGNVDEKINLKLQTSHQLQLKNRSNDITFLLKKESDTIIDVDVRIVKDKTMNAMELYEKPERSFEIYNLKCSASALDEAASPWKRSASFTKTESAFEVEDFKYKSLPLTIDFQSFDILSENPYASLGLYGMKRLDENRYINYNVQMLASTGQYSSFSSSYQYLGYYSPDLQVSLGDINNNRLNAMPMHGKGVSASKTLLDNHTISALYTRNYKIFTNNATQNISLDYSFTTLDKNLRAGAYVQAKYEPLVNSQKSLGGFQMSGRFFDKHYLSLQTDFSQWSFTNVPTPQSLSGMGLKTIYSGTIIPRLNLGLNFQYNTKNFVYYAGTNNLKVHANYRFKNTNSVFSHYVRRRNNPNVWANGVLSNLIINTLQEEAKVAYRLRLDKQSYSLYNLYRQQSNSQYKLLNYGAGVDYLKSISLYTRVNTSVALWRNSFNLNPQDYYNTLQLRLAYRQRNFRLSAHYYYGARYILEHLNYAQNSEIPRSYFLNANYEWWVGKNKKLLINLASNLNYRSTIERFQVNVRPRFNYYVSRGFKLKGYMSFIGFNQKERRYLLNNSEIYSPAHKQGNFEMGLGFVKDIGLPISRQDNFDITFLAFRDDNGNGKKDGNEIIISDMLIVAEELESEQENQFEYNDAALEVITNSNGEAALLNLKRGVYKINTYPLTKGESWYSNRSFSISVTDDRTVMLPQSKGGRIYGRIYLETNDYSRFDKGVSLENIKIVATDKSGVEYSCLTDKDGAYILNAPMGQYTMSVNEVLFSGAFELVENNLSVELNNAYAIQQKNFYVKEKERKVIIKKFGESENEE